MDVSIDANDSAETAGKVKRERSSNFTAEETDLLVSLIEPKKEILESKKCDSATWKQKEKSWKEIENAFNALNKTPGSVLRTSKTLRMKYEGMKKEIRKKSLAMKRGSNKYIQFTKAERIIKRMIFQSTEGSESSDSDDLMPSIPFTTPELSNRKSWLSTDPNMPSDDDMVNESEPRDNKSFQVLVEDEMDSSWLRTQILKEELAQKVIQRKIMEEELEHKKILHDLEIQHYLLKISSLKAELEKK